RAARHTTRHVCGIRARNVGHTWNTAATPSRRSTRGRLEADILLWPHEEIPTDETDDDHRHGEDRDHHRPAAFLGSHSFHLLFWPGPVSSPRQLSSAHSTRA